jgi:hypothetical protein
MKLKFKWINWSKFGKQTSPDFLEFLLVIFSILPDTFIIFQKFKITNSKSPVF